MLRWEQNLKRQDFSTAVAQIKEEVEQQSRDAFAVLDRNDLHRFVVGGLAQGHPRVQRREKDLYSASGT